MTGVRGSTENPESRTWFRPNMCKYLHCCFHVQARVRDDENKNNWMVCERAVTVQFYTVFDMKWLELLLVLIKRHLFVFILFIVSIIYLPFIKIKFWSCPIGHICTLSEAPPHLYWEHLHSWADPTVVQLQHFFKSKDKYRGEGGGGWAGVELAMLKTSRGLGTNIFSLRYKHSISIELKKGTCHLKEHPKISNGYWFKPKGMVHLVWIGGTGVLESILSSLILKLYHAFVFKPLWPSNLVHLLIFGRSFRWHAHF